MSRIIVFSTCPNSGMGGVSTSAQTFTEGLRSCGAEVLHLTTHSPRFGKIRNLFLFLCSIIKFLMVVVFERFSGGVKSVVYVHVAPKGSLVRKVIIACLARLFGLNVNTHYHSITFEGYLASSGVWRRLLLLLCQKSHKNIVLSDWWRQLFQAYGISNIFVIPNAIPDAVELLKSNKSPRREKIIFSMARLEKNKNIQLVISALAFLPDDYQLFIAGDGPYRRELERLTEEMKLTNRVTFLGWLDNVQKKKYYMSSDVFALPSAHDSFGLVFIEALSQGCPVVVGPNPVVRSVLDGLPGVAESEVYSAEDISRSILLSISFQFVRNEISQRCIDKYGLRGVSEKLALVLVGVK